MSDCTIYIGNLDRHIDERDLDDEFYRYGRIRRIELKNGYAFLEFDHPRDADDAIRGMDGIRLEGRRITVERARSGRRGGGGSAPRSNDGPGRCFNCGSSSHWARNCPEGPQDKCFNCGKSGHFARECKEERRSRSPRRDSRSPPRRDSRSPRRDSRSPRRDSRSPPRRERSRSGSRSPRG